MEQEALLGSCGLINAALSQALHEAVQNSPRVHFVQLFSVLIWPKSSQIREMSLSEANEGTVS